MNTMNDQSFIELVLVLFIKLLDVDNHGWLPAREAFNFVNLAGLDFYFAVNLSSTHQLVILGIQKLVFPVKSCDCPGSVVSYLDFVNVDSVALELFCSN